MTDSQVGAEFLPRAGAGVTAVKDDSDMGIGLGYISNLLGKFFVGDVPHAWVAAVITDQSLIQPVRLQNPKFFWRSNLRSMTGKIEEGNILATCLLQMLLKTIDDRLPSGLIVIQDSQMQFIFRLKISAL